MKRAFSDVIEAMTPVAIWLVATSRATKSESVRASCRSLLNHLVRELEDECPRNVSKCANSRAHELGLGDLRKCHWDDRDSVQGKHKGLFKWEHFETVSDLRKAIEGLAALEPALVKEVMSRAKIVWVLKDEDENLKRGARPDPAKAYADAKIELQYPWREC